MTAFGIGTGVLDFVVNDAVYNRELQQLEGRTYRTITQIQSRFDQIGRAARRTLLVGGGALAGAFMQSAKFENQLLKVQTVMGGNKEFADRYRNAIKEMSVEFGKSTGDLSDALYDIISAGTAPAEAITVLRESLKAAVGGFADTKVAARGITAVLAAYEIKAKDVANVSDLMAQAVLMGKLEFSNLADNIGRVAPLASQTGIALDDLLAAVSTLSNLSTAPEAVVQMTGFIKAFVKPSEKSAKAAKAVGIELNATAIQGDNLIATLEKMKTLRPEALAKIFPDIRGTRGALSLVAQIEQLKKARASMKDAKGASNTAFETVRAGEQFQIDRMKQAFIGLAAVVGKVVTPAIMQLTSWIQTAVPVVERWINDNKGAIVTGLKWAGAILVVSAALSPFLNGLRLAAFGIQGLILTFKLAGQAIMLAFANPLITVAVAALALFTATALRSAQTNETWTQSAYAMARVMGLFKAGAQDMQTALDDAAKSSREIDLAWGESKAAEQANDLQAQAEAMRDAARASAERVESLKAAVKAAGNHEVDLLDYVMGTDPGNDAIQAQAKDAQKALEKEKNRLRSIQRKMEELNKKIFESKYGPSPDPSAPLPNFQKELGDFDLDPDAADSKVKGPQFSGVAEMFNKIQSSVFGQGDPIKYQTKATIDNTKAAADNTAAIKDLAKAFRENPNTAFAFVGR